MIYCTERIGMEFLDKVKKCGQCCFYLIFCESDELVDVDALTQLEEKVFKQEARKLSLEKAQYFIKKIKPLET